ncbi:MAG: ABC transporter permease [Hamadaea sp.]|nr:ABC transporter permease [Hamadaea sp.]
MALVGWQTHLRELTSSAFFVMMTALQPIIFATIAFFLFRAGGRTDQLIYAAIGAGMLSLWSTTLIGSGQALTLLRTAGMLELLVAAPVPFVVVLAPITIATATLGLGALVATLGWGWLLFGVPLNVAEPVALAAAVAVTVFGLGMLGLLLAALFVRLRYANALTNLLTYPVWMLSGMLVPVAALPAAVRPLSWLLPTTWGVAAIRASFAGERPWPAIGACAGLGLGYLLLGLLAIRRFERLARRHATLALA